VSASRVQFYRYYSVAHNSAHFTSGRARFPRSSQLLNSFKLDFYNSRPWCELLSGTRSKLVQVFKGRHRADLLVKEILVFSSDLFTVTGQGISLRKRVGSAGARFFQRVLHSTCLVVGMLVLRGAHLLSASAAPTVELSHPMYVQVTVIVSFFFFFFFSDLCSSSTVS